MEEAQETAHGRSWIEVAGIVAGLLFILVVFFVVLPRVANYQDVWRAMRGLNWRQVAVLAAAAILNVATFAPPYMTALPGLRFRSALAVTTASTASTYVAPGGPAVGIALSFAMLRGWGFSAGAVTLAVAVASVWNQLMILGTPALALWLLTAEGADNPLLRSVAVIGGSASAGIVIAFTLGLLRPEFARWLGDLTADLASRALSVIGRGPARWDGDSLVRFRADALELLKRRWHVLTAATLAGHLSIYLVLIVTLRAMGISGGEVSLAESFAAWSLVRVLQAIPITPGGFGVVELGLTGALAGFGGPQAEVVAAVLVYRFLTVVPPLVLGAIAGATWRRHHPGWAAGGEDGR
jgi:uncharacterized protein (TIRG00374 family)